MNACVAPDGRHAPHVASTHNLSSDTNPPMRRLGDSFCALRARRARNRREATGHSGGGRRGPLKKSGHGPCAPCCGCHAGFDQSKRHRSESMARVMIGPCRRRRGLPRPRSIDREPSCRFFPAAARRNLGEDGMDMAQAVVAREHNAAGKDRPLAQSRGSARPKPEETR